jgi:hypothetical protein
MKYFGVKNYERFQHHKKKGPPWVKLHATILHDIDFLRLTDAQRYQLMALFIVASETDNCIPDDRAWLVHRLSTRRLQLTPLFDAGFLCIKNKDLPDQPGATQRPNGTTEREREGEREREKKDTAAATRLPVDFVVPETWISWAEVERPDLDIRIECEQFCGYWWNANGKKALKRIWYSTFKNWIRRAKKESTNARSKQDAFDQGLIAAVGDHSAKAEGPLRDSGQRPGRVGVTDERLLGRPVDVPD